MRRAAWVGVLVACGCHQGVEALDEVLRGCLVTERGAPAGDVPVFLVRDGVAQREARTSADGCFAVQGLAPGRWVLAAHDLQGQGLLEAVHDVDGLFRPLGVRALSSMRLDARWSHLRGLGLPEVLGPATTPWRSVACDASAVRTSDRSGSARLDVRTGEVRASVPVIEVVSRPPGPGRAFDEVLALRWADTGREVPLPEGTDAWGPFASVSDSAFVASAGLRSPEDGGVALSTWVYGVGGRVTPVGRAPCRLVPSGACVREDGAAGASRWNPDGTVSAVALGLAAGEEAPWVAVAPGGARVLAVIRRATGLVASLRRFDDPAVVETPIDGAQLEASPPPLASARFFGFVTVTTGGEKRWVRVGVERGEVLEVPLPEKPPGAVEVPWRGLSALPRLEWVAPAGDDFAVTVAEHLGATARLRSLRVPRWGSPDFTQPAGFEAFPRFSLAAVEAAGLEVLQVGDRAALLETGGRLDAGRGFAMPGLSTTPVCEAGGRLVGETRGADLSLNVVVLDVERLARELGVAPAPR
ncbi:MAG: hypothetical protein INH41_31020 [Myxococcaceae bacterium]|nr:hypothetical protein [Myxococcaceae bacterium]MCA3016839.1 hypothetical protein [Myxococcaceae bacterium]